MAAEWPGHVKLTGRDTLEPCLVEGTRDGIASRSPHGGTDYHEDEHKRGHQSVEEAQSLEQAWSQRSGVEDVHAIRMP